MVSNYNIKITSDSFFQLYNNEIPASELCIGIKKLTQNVYLLKTSNGLKIFNSNNNDEILIGDNNIQTNSNYVRYTEDNKFKFIEFKDFNKFELILGDDKYNCQKYGDFLLYEGRLYLKDRLLVNLRELDSINLKEQHLIFNYEDFIIITDKNIKSELYCISNKIVKGQINDIKIGALELLVNTSTSDYLFDKTGNLIFCGQYGEYLNDGPIKISNEDGDFLWIKEKLIGPIEGFLFEKFTICFESSDSVILIEGEKLLNIDLLNATFNVTDCNVKGLNGVRIKFKKIFIRKFDQKIYVLTDGENFYFYSLKKKMFVNYLMGEKKFDFSNSKLTWLNQEEDISQIEIDCDEIVDVSYLVDSILIIAKKLNEHLLISSKHGLVTKSKKPLAFYQNWGNFVLIDPQEGKKIELQFYNFNDNSLNKLPLKITSVELNKSEEYFNINLDGNAPFTTLSVSKFDNPLS